MAKLGKDEIVTLQVLNEKGASNREIARRLEVTEGAIRYHPAETRTSSTLQMMSFSLMCNSK